MALLALVAFLIRRQMSWLILNALNIKVRILDETEDGSIYLTVLINKTFAQMSRLILFPPAAMGSLKLPPLVTFHLGN